MKASMKEQKKIQKKKSVQGMSEEDMIQEALKASLREDNEHKAKMQK